MAGHSDDRVMLPHYARYGSWSVAIVDLICAEMERSDAGRQWRLLDIGAGLGLVTLGVLRRADVLVDLFEADPATFQLLERNLAPHTHRTRLRTHFCGVGNPSTQDERVAMVRTPGNGGDSRMRKLRGANRPDLTPLRRLDDLVTLHPDDALLVKIDVQGAEPDVFAGGESILGRAALVVVEFWPDGLHDQGHSPERFARRLSRWPGQGALLFDEHRRQEVPWMRAADLLEPLARLARRRDPALQAEVILRAPSLGNPHGDSVG